MAKTIKIQLQHISLEADGYHLFVNAELNGKPINEKKLKAVMVETPFGYYSLN